jgi:hypothetical protein
MLTFLRRWFGRAIPAGRAASLPLPVRPWSSLSDEADSWVDSVLRRAGLGEPVAKGSGWQALNRLDGRRLLMIESEFRDADWDRDPVRMRRVLAAASTVKVVDRAAAYRFAAACSADGFVRQDALQEMIQPTRLDLAVAMIRSQDWVPQVRAAANDAMLEMLWSPDPELLFGLFDLHLVLQRRERGGEGIWQELFDSKLTGEAFAALRWKLIGHEDANVRKAAYGLVLRSDPESRLDALRSAVGDRACWIVMWALSEARVSEDPATRTDLLASISHHPHPAVRAQVLREREELQPHPARLQQSLLDRSRSVRNAAAYLLKSKYGQSALPTWRTIVDGGSTTEFLIAASALAEHADASDASRLGALLAHPSARLRSMAIHALARLDGDELPIQLDRALSDPSPRVLREVVRGYTVGNQVLSPERLARVFESSTTQSCRIALLQAARVLGKWHELAFLAGQAKQADAELFEYFRPHLDSWLWRANSSFAPLPEDHRAKLLDDIEVARLAHPSYRWGRLRVMV